MLKEGGVRLHIRPLFLIYVMKHTFFSWIICRYVRSPYLCTVFFIVLDLRLTKVGVQRYSFFYAYTYRPPSRGTRTTQKPDSQPPLEEHKPPLDRAEVDNRILQVDRHLCSS